MQVKFMPGVIAAYLIVNINDRNTIWVWYEQSKKAQSTQILFNELPEAVQHEITMHFTKVFDMKYTDRSQYMERVRSWSIEI